MGAFNLLFKGVVWLIHDFKHTWYGNVSATPSNAYRQLLQAFLGCCSKLVSHPHDADEVMDFLNTYTFGFHCSWVVGVDGVDDVVTVKVTSPNFRVNMRFEHNSNIDERDMRFDHHSHIAEFWERKMERHMFTVSHVSATLAHITPAFQSCSCGRGHATNVI